jgi:hypothetical protein
VLTAAEHLQRLFNQDQATTNTSIQHYKAILRSIFDTSPLIPQTAKAIDGQIVTALTPTYLCLQCPSTLTEDDRTKHGSKKSHRFCMLAMLVAGAGGRVSAALLTSAQMSTQEAVPCTARCATTLSGIPPLRSSG